MAATEASILWLLGGINWVQHRRVLVLQAVELDSKFVRGFTRAAKAHLCMGHYAAAEQLYRQALAVDNSSREATAELQVGLVQTMPAYKQGPHLLVMVP